MTTKGTPGRMVRIEDDVWADYEQVCKEKGLARAADIRTYVMREVVAWRQANGIVTGRNRLTRKKAADSD